jgi:hypothetical protein
MGGLGRHYPGTEMKTVTGHSLVQGLYLLLGRRCPLTPRRYRQGALCEAEGDTFAGEADILDEINHPFEPVIGTQTHVLPVWGRLNSSAHYAFLYVECLPESVQSRQKLGQAMDKMRDA